MKLAANLLQSPGRKSGALSLREIERAAERVGRQSYRAYFRAIIQSASPLPVRETLESLGLRVVSEYRPFLGISYERQGESLIVSAVAEGGPASRGGMKVGDELLLLDGKPFAPTSIPSLKQGSTATVLVRRKEQTLELSVPVGARESWVLSE
ncbi:MAG: PDZ domain-containing protein [Armatimonadetes bacterium]|nr:PDZ domain-containing protein [Armatimonadota bacterium]